MLFLIILILVNFSTISAKKTYMSQVQQDKFLNDNFFKNKKNGCFVDIGAHDGVTLSNTFFFEKFLDWKGICIEPLPNVFDKLKKNRKSVCINCCVSKTEGIKPFIQVDSKVDVLSGLVETYHPLHLNRLKIELERVGGTYKIINIFCRTLNTILDENNIKKIDYLSIDTEGGEFDILNSIDFNKYKIFAISVEDNYGDPRIRKLLESNGFKYITFLGNLDIIFINTKNI